MAIRKYKPTTPVAAASGSDFAEITRDHPEKSLSARCTAAVAVTRTVASPPSPGWRPQARLPGHRFPS